MATNAAAVAIAMMNGGGGGSGGDVTKQYVDDHLALKADKSETKEYPIADSVSGESISVMNSADGYVQGLTIYGRSEVVEGEIESIGDTGSLDVITCRKNLWNPNNETLFSVTPEGKIWIDSPNSFHSAIFNVKPNTDYTLTCNTSGIGLNIERIAAIPTPNLEYGMYGSIIVNETVNTGSHGYTKTFNTGNTNYILISLGDGSKYNLASHFQLELGSTPTSYEPYISSTASLTTGLPYCGIPVTTGETYTDEQGQKWLADTVDVEGVVKRCYKVTINGNTTFGAHGGNYINNSYRFKTSTPLVLPSKAVAASALPNAICANLSVVTVNNTYNGDTSNAIAISTDGLYFYVRIANIDNEVDLISYLTSNPITVIYELANPTTQELTSAEKSALLNLKTYDSTTNLSITDNPYVDFDYLRNTANGKAAEQLADNLRASIGWISAIPEMHRNIFRGQSLGTSVTAAQLAVIEDGSFDDLYVGDYWTINNTVYRIADMDFFRTDANSPFVFTTHHLVIVPDGTMYKAKMNDSSATTSGGYKNSDMRTTNLSAAKTTINADFPDMVLTYKDLLVTATSSGMPTASDYFDCDIELMSETMLFGGYVNAKPSNPPYFCASTNPTQFALFKLNPQFIITDKSDTIWLRDAADGACFCTMEYSPFGRDANSTYGAVRPFFLIGDAT